jgi:CBS domain-containing protein
VGIFTSNDFLRKIVSTGLDAATLKVGDVMTRNVTVVDLTATSARCVSMMSRGRFRHLPVVDGDRVVGTVTMVDIMAFGVDGADQDVGDGDS